jgi:hypothetical protein
MPKYTVIFNKQNYDIESQNPLTKAELDEAVDNIANQQRATETVGEKVQGFGRAVGDAVTFGQAPHIAGEGKVIGGAIYDFLHGKNPLKELYNDYKSGKLADTYRQGREEYKDEQKKWETLHPKANFVGQAIGTLGTLPAGSAVAKIPAVAKYLKGAGILKKGALAGAGWGGAYGAGEGLSNTEGKGFDFENALIGGGIGAATGATLGTAIPLSVMGIKGGIKGILNVGKAITNKLKTGYKGNTEQYAVPEGVQTKTFRKLAENPEVQKEAERGDIGMRAEEFQNKATEKTLSFVPETFEKVSKDYENLDKNTFLSFAKNNTLQKINEAFKNFGFDTKFMPNETAQKQAIEFSKNLLKATENQNGEIGITYENLQRAMKTTYEMEQKAYNAGDTAVGNLYHNIRVALKEARATNPKIEQTSQKYADISKAKEMLERALGIKFEKGANHRQVATKLIQNARNRAGTQLDDTIAEVGNILKKYPDLPAAKELQNAIDLAQVAYDFRPPTEDKLLNKVKPSSNSFIKTLLWDVPKKALFETSPQEKAKLLAENLKAGRITPQDVSGSFDIINAGKFTTGLNRFLQRQKLYGGKYNPIAMAMRFNKMPKIEYYQNPKGNVYLPNLADEDLALIGKKQKPVLLKQNIVEKNKNHHPEVDVKEYNDILNSGLYETTDIVQPNFKEKPNYYNFIARDKYNNVVVVEINDNKNNFEIVGLFKTKPEDLIRMTKKAKRDGGQSIITKRLNLNGQQSNSALPFGNSIIPQIKNNFNSLTRNPLIPASNSRIRDFFNEYYNNKEQSK